MEVTYMSKNSTTVSFVAEVAGDVNHLIHSREEGHMLILPLRDSILFPGTVNPITIGRKSSLKTVKHAERGEHVLGVFCQKDPEVEDPSYEDMIHTGVAAKVLHTIELPDGTTNVLLQTMNRISLQSLVMGRHGYEGDVAALTDIEANENERTEYETMLALIKERVVEFGRITGNFPPEAVHFIEGMPPSTFMLNLVSGNLPVDIHSKLELLECRSEMKRAQRLLVLTNNIIQLARLKLNVERKTQSDLDQQQREYFINQEIHNLQAELGGHDDATAKSEDIAQLRSQAKGKLWSEKVGETFEKELNKLSRINPQSPDYNVQLNYLQTLVGLPWDYCTEGSSKINIRNAEKRLDKDHYGMEKVKERILEHLAVLRLRGDQKSPILCLYGPPGVGKTSLGRSIAAMKRNYVRISLGGVHDESEIRGHRRTYVGAMPGRIIKGIQKAGSSNPVYILDEIDKISQGNINGDPSSAMLEVLDPEQNNAFHDNFLDIDYDLSRVMFIATANDINTIPRPLLDRMELIEVGGYITEEKIEIARRHLVPKKKEENGLSDRADIKLSRPSLEYLIERYTRESGVRGLEKQIDKLMRKVALAIAKNEGQNVPSVTPETIEEYLGKPPYSRDKYQGNEFAGVVTGLAWTSVGGEILFIETSLSRGKAGKLTLTGNLGDVMKESAMLALEYTKAHADALEIDMRIFDNYHIHIHVPEGAVPKDGPSAGITMATSIASALTQRKVRKNMAMTGEITLRGKVLPVGGIKEKILAAKRAGITDIVLCEENRKDIEEISSIYVKGLSFHYVNTIHDVWEIALTDEKVPDALQFVFTDEKTENTKP